MMIDQPQRCRAGRERFPDRLPHQFFPDAHDCFGSNAARPSEAKRSSKPAGESASVASRPYPGASFQAYPEKRTLDSSPPYQSALGGSAYLYAEGGQQQRTRLVCDEEGTKDSPKPNTLKKLKRNPWQRRRVTRIPQPVYQQLRMTFDTVSDHSAPSSLRTSNEKVVIHSGAQPSGRLWRRGVLVCSRRAARLRPRPKRRRRTSAGRWA